MTLRIPKNPRDLSQCTRRTLMRITRDGEPGVAMLLSGHSTVLFVGKSGVLEEFGTAAYRLEFIDYLTQDESLTIHGDAEARTEDDLAPELSLDRLAIQERPAIEEVGFKLKSIPDFTPYRVRYVKYNSTGACWDFMNVPTKDGGRVTLAKDIDSDRALVHYFQITQRSEDEYRAEMYLDYNINVWRDHYELKRLNVEDPSTWPS